MQGVPLFITKTHITKKKYNYKELYVNVSVDVYPNPLYGTQLWKRKQWIVKHHKLSINYLCKNAYIKHKTSIKVFVLASYLNKHHLFKFRDIPS